MSQIQAAQFLSAGQQYLKLGQYPKAIEMLQRSLAAAPGSFAAHSLLGITLQQVGNAEGAIAQLQSALSIKPDWAEGHSLLGTALAGRGLNEQAADQFRKVIQLKPDHVEALNNLGTLLKSLGRFDEAIVHLRIAVKLRPDQAEIHNNLGNALLESGQTPEALAELEQAVALRPDYVEIYQGLGNSLVSVGKVPDAIDVFRRALTIGPTHHQIHSSLLMTMHYADSANENPNALFEEHCVYHRQHIANLPRPISYPNNPDPNRRLRIGYFSADFRRHSVSFFTEPILANHDSSQFEIICYADVTSPDEVTARLQKHASLWRNVYGQSDALVAQQIMADQVDILIDLSGHTGGGRLPLFGLKPAPVQATYLGYPDTTGLTTIDYRITDSIADPPGECDARYTEKLIRLDPPFLCFNPPANSPDVMPPPSLNDGHITFGSFNTLAKLTPGTIKLWSEVMNAIPGSRMLIKARGLQHSPVADRLAYWFLSHGIERNRLTFLGHETATASHLARYHEVDIALDTFPYNGTTTTCEALWMGVPVVSLCGQIHAARVGASLLNSLGRPEWIANDPEKFIEIATSLASDQAKLAEHRAMLRQQFISSPITNAPAFTRRLEAAFREMWRCTISDKSGH